MNNELERTIKDTDEAIKKRNNIVAMDNSTALPNGIRANANGGVNSNSILNVEIFIETDSKLKELLSYDEFSDQIIKTKDIPDLHFKKSFWGDNDIALLRGYLEKSKNVLFSKDNISDAVINIALKHAVNPVKARIESVKWDGVKRASRYFIDYLGAEDNAYTRSVTKTWLTGMIARVYRPGVKFELVPILEGKQGIGKSTAIKNLFPDKFNDSVKGLGTNKDDYQQLQDSLIIEIAELSAMKKTDVENMKNFISAGVDKYRGSYGRFSTPHPRKCVFIGTTNQTDYLKDATGERRFYPIKCGMTSPIKDALNVDDNEILQVIAEAKSWFDNNEPLYLDKTTVETGKHYQEEAKIIDPLKDTIERYLNTEVPTNWDELSDSLKHSYIAYDKGDLAHELSDKYDKTKMPLQKTSYREILAVVFDKSPDRYLSGRTNAEAKHVKLIMDNMPGWEANGNVSINRHRQRGYVRSNT